MAGGKLSPRQKMINMMYLVLTALLALNISKDILLALTKLDDSLEQTVATVETKNQEIYAAFESAANENPEKAGKWRDKAVKVRSEAEELTEYIEGLKTELIDITGGPDEETGQPIGLDNKEKVANYLLNEKRASELKSKIESYRALLLNQAEDQPQLQASIKKTFDTSKQEVSTDGTMASWEQANFEHYPLAAVLPFLTDIQAKVRNTESDVISNLRSNIGKSDLNFSGIKAVVMPKSTYVTKGDKYEAEVFVAAFDETQEPTITINGEQLDPSKISGGVGKVEFPATSVGEQKWAGMITIEQIGKDPVEVPVEASYTVAPPTAVISPTKMNVLYRGVDNPLEIGVPGVAPEKLVVSGAGVSKVGSGEYMANVSNVKGRELNIRVGVQEEEGKVRDIGSKTFRIKGLPPALGSMYKRSGGQLGKGLLKAGKVDARYENFPFDLNLNVVSFEVVVPGFPPEKVNGNTMPSSVKTRIDRMNPGQTLLIRNIKARGPKGVRIPEVASISFDVN